MKTVEMNCGVCTMFAYTSIHILRSLTCLVTIILACGSVTEDKSNYAFWKYGHE